MKVFSLILALYMMVLFLIPCADAYEKEIFQIQQHAHEVTQQDDHDHSGMTDLCTPFCFCGCCGMVSGVVLHLNVFFTAKVASFDLPKPEIAYDFISLPLYAGEIWQPPKIKV